MTDLFKSYLETYSVGTKELNGMLSSKITQLRAERTKVLYNYFHESILPAMTVIEPKVFKQIVKSMSQIYRNKDIDVEDCISQIDPLLTGKHIDTRSPSPARAVPNAQVPESPSHAVMEKKKALKAKCPQQPKFPPHTTSQQRKTHFGLQSPTKKK